jgi:acetoin utilization deacetylase AcuC-like enzyme
MASTIAPCLYSSPLFQEHLTGTHPESPERLRFLQEYLAPRPLLSRFRPGEFDPAGPQLLELVHRPAYVAAVREFASRGGGRVESDTIISSRSYDVACLAVGAATAAVDAVLTGKTSRALCLVRPPGHHALAAAPMGFCLFGNVSVAAAHALRAHHLERVLIVDWDVHHGNGTQDMFYDNGQVYFFSAHRFPFYPGTGAANETGTGAGLGTKFNLPLRFGTPRSGYLQEFQTVLEQAAARCRPELILISAGFDAHAADPVGSLGLQTEDFEPLTKLICQVADQYCQWRVVSLLEGGYNVRALAESIECHMQALL